MRILRDINRLREKSKETSIDECKEVFLLMEKAMKDSPIPAAGLAAIQIDIPLRACIVKAKISQDEEGLVRMINPVIEEKYDPIRYQNEGCLSFDIKVDTDRYAGVVANWIDFDTKEKKRATFYGVEAVVVQHEVDHLDGILMIDRAVKKIVKSGRNDPCPCGSGKKYKKCCGR